MALDRPAIGSGLVALGGAFYLGITDRGPNVDHFPVNSNCLATGGANAKTISCGKGPTYELVAGARPNYVGQPKDSNVVLNYR